MLKQIDILQVDAFTNIPSHGNAAGVVLNASGLSDNSMQIIAKEMGCSETAFLFPDRENPGHYRVRYFTPASEVPLCGHATIASFFVNARNQFDTQQTTDLKIYHISTNAGKLTVRAVRQRNAIKVWMELPVPDFRTSRMKSGSLAKILGLKTKDFDSRYPIVTNARSVFVPLKSYHALKRINYDVKGLEKFLSQKGLFGLSVFTTETIERKSTFHSRYFAPGIGVAEDPVTGTANGPIGAYIYKHRLVSIDDQKDTIEFVGEQGDIMGRPGRVNVSLSVKSGKVTKLFIGGTAVVSLEGTISYPA